MPLARRPKEGSVLADSLISRPRPVGVDYRPFVAAVDRFGPRSSSAVGPSASNSLQPKLKKTSVNVGQSSLATSQLKTSETLQAHAAVIIFTIRLPETKYCLPNSTELN